MSKQSKLPALQFYVGDWRKDPGIQALNYEERGIWLELLFLMHESEQRGKLMLGSKPYPLDRLGYVLRLSPGYLEVIITTLLDMGVASRCEETGALMNRRMVRDADLSEKRKNAGKGGGNPNFQKGKPNPYYPKDGERLDNQKDNQKITPSSSVSSSSSTSSIINTHTPREADELPGNEEPGHRKTKTQANATEQGQGEAGPVKPVPPDLQAPKNASETILDANSDLAEIPSWDQWRLACEMQGIPEAFALHYFQEEDEKDNRWSGFAWRRRIPKIKTKFDTFLSQKVVDQKGVWTNGTLKANGSANGRIPHRASLPKSNEIDWSTTDF